MSRYLVAHLPTFRLERCGWTDRDLVALVEARHGILRICCVTRAAIRRGVQCGMSLAEARAHAPSLQAEHLDAEGEAADLAELSRQLLRVSPRVAPLPPDALVAELSRSHEDRAGVERALVERVRIRLAQLGHRARVVVADDPGTALVCATWGGRCQVIAPGQGPVAMKALPLRSLGLPPAEHALLEGLGIHTVGAFAALEPAAVAGRLGPVGVAAHAMARGYGPPSPLPLTSDVDDPDALVCRQDLPDPVDRLDALLFVLNALLRSLAIRLTAIGRAATRLGLTFELDDGARQELSLRLGAPTRSPERMLTLLRARLERFQLAAPTTGLVLRALEAPAFDGRQTDLLAPAHGGEAFENLVARLRDALGTPAVITPRLVSRHRPESAWEAVPWQGPSAGSRSGSGRSATARNALRPSARPDDPVAEWRGGWSEPPPPDRPPLLAPTPVAIDVRRSRGSIQAIALDGRWLDVIRAHGPELLSGEWWESPYHREYWRIHLQDGRQAWIYRQDGCWALHGWWDR